MANLNERPVDLDALSDEKVWETHFETQEELLSVAKCFGLPEEHAWGMVI